MIARALVGAGVVTVRLLPRLIVVVLAVAVPANALLAWVNLRASPESLRWLLATLTAAFVASSLVEGGVAALVAEARERAARPSVRDALRRLGPRVLPLAAASLAVFAAVAVGAVFLVFPAIVIGVWMSLVPQIVVIERGPWREALGRSYDLVRRRTFGVVLFLLGGIVLQHAVVAAAPVLVEPSEDFVFTWLTYVAWDLGVTSVVGVTFAVVYYHLLALDRDEPPPTFTFR